MCAKSPELRPTLCDPMDFSLTGSSVHGDSPGKNTRVGCHALLQGIFLQHLLRLLHCRQILYCCVTGEALKRGGVGGIGRLERLIYTVDTMYKIDNR